MSLLSIFSILSIYIYLYIAVCNLKSYNFVVTVPIYLHNSKNKTDHVFQAERDAERSWS